MGPWEEASPGILFRQEVLWDALETTGTTLANGSFESLAPDGKTPAGWQGDAGTVEKATSLLPAIEGKHFARTWHNHPLTTSLRVTNGVPVTLKLHARAAVPPDFKEMRRITKQNSPAHRAAKKFLRGANLGNYLEAPPGQDWGAKYSTADFVNIRQEGFDHVRLPIAWNHYAGAGPEFKLSDEIYAKADFLVTNALKQGLNVLVNIHHFDAFTSSPAEQTEKFYALWRQLAAHYAKAPAGVAFELLNEPKDKATTTALNPIYAEAIRQIRQTNPKRTIFVGPGKWNSIDELGSLVLPDTDDNLIVTVHCYEPFYFTHQGATWSGPDTKTKGIIFPGPPVTPLVPDPALKLNPGVLDWIKRYNALPLEKNPSSPQAFRGKVEKASQWSQYYGRPIHMGEFGAYIGADAASRARFYAEFRRALDEKQMGWAVWDWKAGFKYWDDARKEPAPGMREALFSKPKP